MAAIDIKSVLELLRTKVHGADSSTSLDELNNMVKAAQLAHTPMIRHYDSDGSLPTATTTEQRLAFITSTGSIKMNNGRRWESTVSTASEGGGSSLGPGQGASYGYAMGGYDGANSNVIGKFSITSAANGTDAADLTVARWGPSGSSSTTHGYAAGGGPGTTQSRVIDKFEFATDGNATDVGDLDYDSKRGNGAMSTTHGYLHMPQQQMHLLSVI